jgi:copper(I)-binding protein
MNTSPTRRLRHGVFALTAATTLLIGCSSDGSDSTATVAAEASVDSISIEIARSPIPTAGQTTTPVYGILVNDSLSEMRVISATSPAADSVDLLGPDDSIVLPAEGFNVLPDGGLVMEPVGFKLMLNGIDPDTIGGEIPVTLRFQSGESFAFSAIVQELDS